MNKQHACNTNASYISADSEMIYSFKVCPVDTNQLGRLKENALLTDS
jgi:hypothetical protein